ncbi:hypothetical protein CRG98_017993 [Punica granatum]|uniref:Uncharacterized protein n=1 Tax=Punica granatum TaxID=22663 RepID=A0A2I0JZ61_PUNGR|nr:hypothetical protein CRG98_017993 [Punica granatum]
MAANMAELFALFRGPNRASSSSTPPSGQEPTVDPTPWIPPTHAPESVDAPALPTTHAAAVYPVTISLPPPPAPTAVPLPQAAFLTSDQTMSAPPPVFMSISTLIYTAFPPMVFPASTTFAPAHITESFPFPTPQPNISLPYQAPPSLNIPFPELGTSIHAALVAPLMNFLSQEETEQERRMKKMEETIKALQVKETRLDMGCGDWSLFPGTRLPPKFKIHEFTTYEGVYYSHLLAHSSSFSNLIEVGKKLDMGIKLCKIEGPVGRTEGESSKKATTEATPMGGQKEEGSIRQRHQSRAPRFIAVYCELPTYATDSSSLCFAPCPVPTTVLLGTATYPTIPSPAANRPPLHSCSFSDPAIRIPDYEICTTGATSSRLIETTG